MSVIILNDCCKYTIYLHFYMTKLGHYVMIKYLQCIVSVMKYTSFSVFGYVFDLGERVIKCTYIYNIDSVIKLLFAHTIL